MIILDSKATIQKALLTPTQINLLKSHFTLANPMFFKMESMGKPTWATPRNLHYYEEDDEYFTVPLGGAPEISKIIDTTNLQLIDDRFENDEKIKIKFKGKLRNYQTKASKEITSRTIGTIQATTGSGKTVIAIHAICKRKQPTLFLVNTIELANQFRERLLQFTDIDPANVGLIGDGKYEIRDVSVGILQTMTKLDDDKIEKINSHFGQVFVDEVHIVPANTFFAAMSKLRQKYRFGLTATPFRADGLTDVIFFTTGKIVHQIDPREAEGHLIIPDIEYVETDYKFPLFDSSEHSVMLTDMATDKARNQLIIDKYKEVGVERQSVFISHRVAQLEELAKHIPNCAILTSKLTKKKRADIMDRLQKNELKAVLTTYGLFSTGIDVGTLEVVYQCTPMRSPRWVIQTAGRLKRKAKGKDTALVVDFVDKKISMLRNQYYARRTTWKKIKNQEI